MTESPWLTVAEAAQYLKFAPETIRLACRTDKLRHSQVGGNRGKILTTRAWLDEWAYRHTHGGE